MNLPEGFVLEKSNNLPEGFVLEQKTTPSNEKINPYEMAMREALQNIPQGKRIMGSALAGLGGETIKNVGALTELASKKYGKPITEFGQAMTTVANEANPVMGTIGQIGSYVAPANVLNKGAEFINASKTLPALMTKSASVGGTLGFLTTPDSLLERGKSALLNAGVSGALTGAGSKIASLLRGPEQTPQMADAIKKAREVDYVIPPTQANESLLNRSLEGTAGKITTQQNASAKNQIVTNKLAAKSLGLPEETVITPEVLSGIRNVAGDAYKALEILPIKPEIPRSFVMNQSYVPEINPKKMVYDLRIARNDADAYYKAYSRSADPEQLTKAKLAKNKANEIETKLEDYAKSLGKDELLPQLKDARQLIAKTYTIEKALNPTSGTVDAKKLASELKKGKPLTEELKTAAEFAGQFPKAAQTTEMMGGRPQINPLDVGAAGILSSLTNPAALATVAVRPTARSLALSPYVQNRLIQSPVNESNQDLSNLAKMLMLQQTTQGTQP